VARRKRVLRAVAIVAGALGAGAVVAVVVIAIANGAEAGPSTTAAGKSSNVQRVETHNGPEMELKVNSKGETTVKTSTGSKQPLATPRSSSAGGRPPTVKR
jgi:hypothetical protein